MAGSNPFITEAFALLAVALTIIFLRTIARATSVGIRQFQLDDYMMLVAAVSLDFAHKFNALSDNMVGRLFAGDRRRIHRRSLVAWSGKQWDDTRTKSHSGPFISRMGHANWRFQDPGGWLVSLHVHPLESEALHVCLLCATDVSAHLPPKVQV
jgi:hypothetical protein